MTDDANYSKNQSIHFIKKIIPVALSSRDFTLHILYMEIFREIVTEIMYFNS